MTAAKAKKGARPPAAAAAAPALEVSTGLLLASYLVPIVLLFGAFLGSNGTFYGSDTFPMGYMARSLYKTMWERFHEFPLWNPYILGGLPFVDALHGDIFYPTTILKFLMPLHRGIGFVLILHVYLAGVFMFLFLRGEGASKLAAWFGGLAYMAGPYLISLILAGHDGKIYVTTLFPLLFWLLRRAERRGRLGPYLLFGLGVGLLILTAHIQMAYFSLWALGLQFLTHAWSERKEPRRLAGGIVGFAAALAIGLAVGAVQLYPSYVYTSRFGPRAGGLGYETATSWSLHPEEIVSLAVPEFVSYLDGYWGRNPFKLNCESPGVIPAILALAFLLFAKGERRRFFGFLLGGSLVYALGANTPIFRLFYAILPGVKLFRAPSIIAFLAHFAVVVVAALGVDRWLVRRTAPPEERRRVLILLGGIGVALLLLLAAGPGFLAVWGAFDPALTEAKRHAFAGNAGNMRVGALLALGACGLIAWLVSPGGARGRMAAPAALALLVAATLLLDWRIDKDFIRVEPLETYVRTDPVIEFLKKQGGGPFRVVSATSRYQPNYLPIFEIESAQGFHDNRVRTYDELVLKDPGALGRPGMLDLLNVRYLVADRALGGAYREVFHDGRTLVLENPGALSRASLLRRYEVVSDEDALARMHAPAWDPRGGLLLATDPGTAVDGAGDASGDHVEITRYTPNRLAITVDAASPAILLVTNNHLPYWHAAVDGRPATLLRADVSFQAVPVPAGHHEVSLSFRSPPFTRARAATLLGLIAAAAGLLADVLLGRRRGSLPSAGPGAPARSGASPA